MSGAIFDVIEPGIFTTIQDLGRKGHFASGIPPSGAMDRFALRMGNLLVGNPLEEAGIEMTALGMKLLALRDGLIAVTGAEFEARVNGSALPLWETLLLREGDILALGKAVKGWRGYVCVAGGIDVPTMLGSKSTYTLGGLGGIRGRPLRKGDVLHAGPSQHPFDRLRGRRAREDVLPRLDEARTLRVILGPQDDHVRDESVATFLTAPYTVSIRSNRVGYRFEGPQLYFKERAESLDAGLDPSNIVDDGNAIGAIQIPAGKEPICLGPDGVTMGGYVKIACLISADMDRMAQLRLRDSVHFEAVSVQEAGSLLRKSIEDVTEKNVSTV